MEGEHFGCVPAYYPRYSTSTIQAWGIPGACSAEPWIPAVECCFLSFFSFLFLMKTDTLELHVHSATSPYCARLPHSTRSSWNKAPVSCGYRALDVTDECSVAGVYGNTWPAKLLRLKLLVRCRVQSPCGLKFVAIAGIFDRARLWRLCRLIRPGRGRAQPPKGNLLPGPREGRGRRAA